MKQVLTTVFGFLFASQALAFQAKSPLVNLHVGAHLVQHKSVANAQRKQTIRELNDAIKAKDAFLRKHLTGHDKGKLDAAELAYLHWVKDMAVPFVGPPMKPSSEINLSAVTDEELDQNIAARKRNALEKKIADNLRDASKPHADFSAEFDIIDFFQKYREHLMKIAIKQRAIADLGK